MCFPWVMCTLKFKKFFYYKLRKDVREMQLSELIEVGCVSSDLQNVDFRALGVKSISEIKMSSKKQAFFDGVVIADNCKWAATLSKIPIVKATRVYSSDGEVVCVWNRETRTFLEKHLRNGRLITTSSYTLPEYEPKIFKSKGDKIMAGLTADLTAELEHMNIDGIAGTGNDSIAGAAVEAGKETLTETQKIKEMIKERNIQVEDNTALWLYNQKHGYINCFVTKTDKTIRVSLAAQVKKDAQGHPILLPGDKVSAADRKQHEEFLANKEGVKEIGRSNFVKEKKIQFKESKPGKPIAVVITTPIAGLVDTYSLQSKRIELDREEQGVTTQIMDMETAYEFIVQYYNGRIMESKQLLGNKASWLQVKFSVPKQSATTEGSAITKIKKTLSLVKEANSTRKSVLTTGNYVPLQVYDSIDVAKIATAEDSNALNLNIESLLSKPDNRNALAESELKLVQQDTEGNWTSSYFTNKGSRTSIPTIVSFDTGEALTTVSIPKREKKVTASGSITYKYVMSKNNEEDFLTKIADRADVKPLIASTGKTPSEFFQEIKKVTKKASTSSRADKIITVEDYRKLASADNSSIKDLANKIAAITA